MSRRTTAGLILGAWVATLGWLGARHLLTAADPAGPGTRRLPPASAFYAVTLGAERLGIASVNLDTSTTGYRMTEVLSLDLPGLPRAEGRHVARAEYTLSRSVRLRSAWVSLSEGRRRLRLEAQVDDSVLEWRGRPEPGQDGALSSVGLTDLSVPGGVLFQLAAGRALEPGQARPFVTFDVLSGTIEGLTARVVAESTFVIPDSAARETGTGRWVPVTWDTLPAWRVERKLAGTTVVDWVDANGLMVRREYPFGAVLQRSAFDLINSARRLDDHDDGEATRAPPAGATIYRGTRPPGRNDRGVRVVVGRRDSRQVDGGAASFAGPEQEARGDTVLIRREGGEGGEGAPPPMRYRHTGWMSAGDLAVLQAALREALERYGAESDTLTAMIRWVARDLRYLDGPDAPVAPAVVLRARGAGAEGKAFLAVALARVAGYPARVVSGLVLSDPALPAHTWIEVWAGRWRSADPGFGQVPAAGPLLRVMEGPARPAVLVPRVGALRARWVTPSQGEPRR